MTSALRSIRVVKSLVTSGIVVAAAMALLATFVPNSIAAEPADWTEFRGPTRDAISTETGLMQEWPDGGPKLLWKIQGLGVGYSSLAIVDGKIYTMGDLDRDGATSQYVICLDLEAKEEVWVSRVGPPHGDGSRCTPTVDGELLYAIGTSGDLVCMKTATGEVVWRKNFGEDFGGEMMSVWKFSESPLVDGDRVVCTPGGKNATIVALDKLTGETIWKCGIPDIGPNGKDGAGYSSIVISNACGIRQYVQLLGRGVVGVAAADGRFLWGYNPVANGVANISNPVVDGDYVFASTSYSTGSGLVKLSPDGARGVKAEEVYFLEARDFENHHGGVVLVGDYLYGGTGKNNGTPVCIEMKTGRIVWKDRAPAGGSAAIVYADGRMIWRFDRGPLLLIEPTPEGLSIKGKLDPVTSDGPAWAHPVVHNGRLYLRHREILACYDILAK